MTEMERLARHSRALYKEFLKYSRVHPNREKSKKYQEEIRRSFRSNEQINNPEQIEELLKKAQSRLSFLRMQIPSSRIPVRERMKKENPQRKTTGTTFQVNDHGEIAVGVSRLIKNTQWSTWRNLNIDPDEKRKNDYLLERVHYRGPYWEKRRRGWLPDEVTELWEGPSLSEALLNPGKYDIGIEIPTERLEDHPDLKGKMLDMARRNDCIGVKDEPEIQKYTVQPKRTPSPEQIRQDMAIEWQHQEEDKKKGRPTPLEFLSGRRKH
ncbi:hypothetical protein RFI_02270 [Reticulomyxa filosa]|uniref:Complex 1 LYR protein domain-containing protein n=1 Tax=Reticulomyxa filosa TaxID=46433 RepID=X6P9M0_RETFI|nr:hypothetical protein RFI_02270 [Reticulomyxa filosa]|eukprot:ETO34818.1 hypothetical protein RFI_02270 [Reticulomyxa filosa]